MSDHQVETVSSGADRAKVALAVLAVVAGIVGWYMLAQQPLVVRLASILAGVAAGAAIAWFSGPGQRFLAFAKDSWSETKRVVWPEKKETWMVTAYVFAFVVVMALFLWVVDKSLEWVLYDLILGWKR
ncbi:MAG: preprotein translocase subunit SecE [Burkholderiaceae bacterium]|jgi:preprotein translocase subunit SecE|nr:preprotein translocase subunit SecE [Burkholderiales bacterium]MCZ8104494.1 preprotein translocase subunit SecE [Burkholderiales bacterium]MCZ8338340.1 preprotein translocase subunit SecE [Burkholderiaceae bacterium]